MHFVYMYIRTSTLYQYTDSKWSSLNIRSYMYNIQHFQNNMFVKITALLQNCMYVCVYTHVHYLLHRAGGIGPADLASARPNSQYT